MTMFTELYALATTATLSMVISADEKRGTLTISVMPKPKKDAGEPALTKDLTLTAAPAEFDEGFAELMKRGEFVSGVALGDPRSSRLFRWRDGERLVTDGPYAEGKEHLAGFFLIDVESAERAEEIGRFFAGPGETVELRPVMETGGPED